MHNADILKRLDESRYRQGKHRYLRNTQKEDLKKGIKNPKTSLSYKKMTPKELAHLKKEIRHKARKERFWSFIWSTLATILISTWLWSLF